MLFVSLFAFVASVRSKDVNSPMEDTQCRKSNKEASCTRRTFQMTQNIGNVDIDKVFKVRFEPKRSGWAQLEWQMLLILARAPFLNSCMGKIVFKRCKNILSWKLPIKRDCSQSCNLRSQNVSKISLGSSSVTGRDSWLISCYRSDKHDSVIKCHDRYNIMYNR